MGKYSKAFYIETVGGVDGGEHDSHVILTVLGLRPEDAERKSKICQDLKCAERVVESCFEKASKDFWRSYTEKERKRDALKKSYEGIAGIPKQLIVPNNGYYKGQTIEEKDMKELLKTALASDSDIL